MIVPSCYTYGTPLLTLEPTQVQYCALLITLTLPVGAPAWGCAHAGRARPVCGEFLQLRKKKTVGDVPFHLLDEGNSPPTPALCMLINV